ncbi:MAG: DNA cytosine methyltransferase [Prochloraceae cyanobacterium]
MKSQLISVRNAALTCGYTPQYIRKLLRSGKLKGQKVGQQWVIEIADFNKFKNNFAILKSGPQSEIEPVKLDRSSRNTSSKSLGCKALSFFTGAMGLDLGLEKSGIEIVLASEIDKNARQTIAKNKPDCPLIGDLRNYNAAEILKIAGFSKNSDVDLIVGGPPCQSFSTAGKRLGFNDERGNVFLSFVQLIAAIRPKYAIIENVRGLLSAPLLHRPHNQRGENYAPLSADEQPGGALRYILTKLENAGYGVSFNLYNAANFGSPQMRERVILICDRDGHELPYLEPTHSNKSEFNLPKWITFREAIAGLPSDGHNYINFPEKRLKYYKLLKAGQNWKNLPLEVQKEALGKSYYAGGGKTGFLRRIAWDKPCPTLVSHPAMPATDLAHPELDRPLSVEEYKRVQEFPDDWFIAGKILNQYKQIGNAVSVSLGEAVGKLILKHMNGEKIFSPENFPYSRYLNCDHKSWKSAYFKELSN